MNTILDLDTWSLGGVEWSVSRSHRFTPKERVSGIYWIEIWLGPRTSLNALEYRKISCRESNADSQVHSPSLYRLSHSGFRFRTCRVTLLSRLITGILGSNFTQNKSDIGFLQVSVLYCVGTDNFSPTCPTKCICGHFSEFWKHRRPVTTLSSHTRTRRERFGSSAYVKNGGAIPPLPLSFHCVVLNHLSTGTNLSCL
jgi:hypothetical protein